MDIRPGLDRLFWKLAEDLGGLWAQASIVRLLTQDLGIWLNNNEDSPPSQAQFETPTPAAAGGERDLL